MSAREESHGSVPAAGGQEAHEVDWQVFVARYGWRARASFLAHVLGRTAGEVINLRGRAPSAKGPVRGFAELFALRHGRAPADAEWPAPSSSVGGGYEWLEPELALLATLCGQMGLADIADTLTERLKGITGDLQAQRTRSSLMVQLQRMGMQASEVLGGVTIPQAGREFGSIEAVRTAVDSGKLATHRIGRLHVIPHDAWHAWKAMRTPVPDGFVKLASIRQPLGIASDGKLAEFAACGYIPTAVRLNARADGPNTQFGTWYIDQTVADQLVRDRHAGLPMPWHGKPLRDNLRTTYKLWTQRKHPADCPACVQIWGEAGAPTDFDEYCRSYPPLDHGAKRHLTRIWTPGLTVADVARQTGQARHSVRRAIASGMLAFTERDGKAYVTQTDVTRWVTRKCPSGESAKSWMTLQTACDRYWFTPRELKSFIAQGKLTTRVGDAGPQRGVTLVGIHQVATLRREIGFTPQQAASRLGITVERLHTLLKGAAWRLHAGSDSIPLETIQSLNKRILSREGCDLEQAAERLQVSVEWIEQQVKLGLVRVSRARWDRRRRYLTEPMMTRLQTILAGGTVKARIPARPPTGYMGLYAAAHEAGVSVTTVARWAAEGLLIREAVDGRTYFHRDAVRARARTYWANVRFRRATPPAWLVAERSLT